MDEDELGPRQSVVTRRYETCTRCGRVISPAEATVPRLSGEGPSSVGEVPGLQRPLETTQENPPPVLCPTCAREVASGDLLEPPEAPRG